MRERLAIDRQKFYGFDYDNNETQGEAALVIEEKAKDELSVKEAFLQFAGGHEEARHRQPQRPPFGGRGEHHNRDFNHFSGSAPRFAPPAYVPQMGAGLRAVDPGALSGCLYSSTYIWLNNRQNFWFFPTFIGRRSVAGFRWMHNRWVYMGFDLRMVESFFCGGR